MSTRKRKQDEELVALPSDESEEEEEYVDPFSLHNSSSLSSRITGSASVGKNSFQPLSRYQQFDVIEVTMRYPRCLLPVG